MYLDKLKNIDEIHISIAKKNQNISAEQVMSYVTNFGKNFRRTRFDRENNSKRFVGQEFEIQLDVYSQFDR